MKQYLIQAFAEAKGQNKRKASDILDMLNRRPRLWKIVQKTMEEKYLEETGQLPSADWQSFLDWLIENLPAILKMLSLLLAFL